MIKTTISTAYYMLYNRYETYNAKKDYLNIYTYGIYKIKYIPKHKITVGFLLP